MLLLYKARRRDNSKIHIHFHVKFVAVHWLLKDLHLSWQFLRLYSTISPVWVFETFWDTSRIVSWSDCKWTFFSQRYFSVLPLCCPVDVLVKCIESKHWEKLFGNKQKRLCKKSSYRSKAGTTLTKSLLSWSTKHMCHVEDCPRFHFSLFVEDLMFSNKPRFFSF